MLLFVPRCGIDKNGLDFEVVEIPVIDLPGLRTLSFNIFLGLRLLSCGFKTRPDVVYLRRTTSIVPLLYACLRHTLFFFEVNDDPYHGTVAADDGQFLSRLRNVLSVRLDEWSLGLSDRAFVISPEIISKILKKNPSLPPSKFMLMPSGANVDMFLPIGRDLALAAVELDASKRYVGFVGTLMAHQGIEVLIKAAGTVLSQEPDCRFLIIGEGPMKEEWQRMVKRLGLRDAFTFTGQIPYNNLLNWINAMDVCVAPYSGNAGYRSPVKIFDYLACGRPVVASLIRGTTDFFKGLEAVTLVEPEVPRKLAEAILSFLGYSAYCEQISLSGREWVTKNYSRALMARKVSDVAAGLLAKQTRYKKGKWFF